MMTYDPVLTMTHDPILTMTYDPVLRQEAAMSRASIPLHLLPYQVK